MRSHSESNIFSVQERYVLRQATAMVAALGDHATNLIRCHELARAVGHLLGLTFQDGFYGFVDHSWLWTTPVDPRRTLTSRIGFPNILDVYAVGRLPQVTLVDGAHPQLPHVGWSYRPGPLRDDIDDSFVQALVVEMRGVK